MVRPQDLQSCNLGSTPGRPKGVSMFTLDLHRIKHEDARSLTIKFVEKYWDLKCELRIITGHSNRMKKIVIKVLDEYDLKYYIGDRFELNTGFIRVEL